MAEIPSDALATLNALTSAWNDASANTGGQEWPPPGERVVSLVGAYVSTRERAKRDEQGNFHDATEISFEYHWPGESDPTTGAEARAIQFRGTPFRMFSDTSWMKEGQKGYYLQREMARLKGHLSKMLGMTPDELPPIADCIETITEQLEAGAEIALKLKIVADTGDDGNVYNRDFVLANVG